MANNVTYLFSHPVWPLASGHYWNVMFWKSGPVFVCVLPRNKDSVTWCVFILQDPTAEDGGSYKCTAQNEFGTSNANLALNFGEFPLEIGVIGFFQYVWVLRKDH